MKCAVATCWEEGPKAYHTCNNSWYTLFDGGPWNPWIPSKQNTHAPAANEAEDSGIVAIPHLSRDLLACFDGNGSNVGTHPQNVLRGMIYDPDTWEYPYLYNLIDQYRSLGKYNDGYSYNMMFVGPGWMNKMGRWEAPYELLLKSYEDGMAYYAKLKAEGKLEDMTMAQFADFYRAGYFTHYAGEGTIRSCKLTHKGEEVDLCLTRTWAHFAKQGTTRVLTLEPVEIKFADLTVKVQTVFEFEEGSSVVKTCRRILESSDPAAKVELNEYITACYGTTEYPEDMTSVVLGLQNGQKERSLQYAYRCREDEMAGGEASALVPPIETRVTLAAAGEHTAYYKEGYAFSPMFTLGAKGEIGQGEEMVTWLRLEKAN